MHDIQEMMSPELIKTIIGAATARPTIHFSIRVVKICGKPSDSYVPLRNTSPSMVVIKPDGRIGFRVDEASFITDSEESTKVFSEWLLRANESATRQEDYGQPGKNCKFMRCS